MYNETYDNYIRSILGYSLSNNQFEQYNQQNYEYYRNPTFNDNINTSGNNIELEKNYPEIYKIVYPMIVKKCDSTNWRNISNYDIENMTDEIYYYLEENTETNLVETGSSKIENRKMEIQNIEKTNKIKETRQMNNGLRDLIKILLIRELINRPKPPFRPPMPNPPGPGPRPPVRPPFRTDSERIQFNRNFI